MSSEQPPRDALRPYRPLPSVEVPLLRGERSAVRNRRLTRALLVAALGGVGAATFVGVRLFDMGNAPTTGDLPDVRPAKTPDAPLPQAGTAMLRGAAPAEAPVPGELAEPIAPPPPTQEPTGSEQTAPKEATAASPPSATQAADLPVGREASATRSQYTFGTAISFKDALEKNAALSRDEANELIAALTGVLDFRRSQPTDQLTVERSSSGKLVRFEYRSGVLSRYEAERGRDDKLHARQIQVPIKVVRVERGGSVRGSLGDALEGLNLGRSLAGVFAETFEGKINFSTDTRAGDTFRIIFEEEHVEGQFLRYGDVLAIEYKGEHAGARQAFWHAGKDGDGDFYDADGRAMHGGWLRTPLRYDHVSSGFGMRMHPVLKRKLLHNGIDYAAGSGTPVRAGAAGTVTFAGPKGANGNLISISHAQGYETYYAHLLRFAPGIKKGTKVSQRQLVGYVGSTGRSTGPHLHFSLKRQGRFLDPLGQLNGPGLMMPAAELVEHRRHVRELSGELARINIEEPKVIAPEPAPPSQEELGEEEL